MPGSGNAIACTDRAISADKKELRSIMIAEAGGRAAYHRSPAVQQSTAANAVVVWSSSYHSAPL